jgi:GGDEF domain-containing protein
VRAARRCRTHTLEHLLRPGAGEIIVGRWDLAGLGAAIIGPEPEDAKALVARCAAELEVLSAGWRGGQGQPHITVSLGLAGACAENAATYRRVELLIQAAAKALEASQEAGGACVRTFTPRQAA